MTSTLVVGEIRDITAYRYVRDPATGKWSRAERKQRTGVFRYRAQGQVLLPDGSIATADRTAPTKEAATERCRKALEAFVEAAAAKARPAPTSVTALAQQWLGDPVAQASYARSTARTYSDAIRRWLHPRDGFNPPLLTMLATAVEPADVSAWLLDVGATSGRATAKTARSALSAVLTYGVNRRLLTRVVSAAAKVPGEAVIAARREQIAAGSPLMPRRRARPGPSEELDHDRALTPTEMARVLKAAEAVPWSQWDLPAILLTLAATGERLGGVLALHWDDIDLGEPGEVAWATLGQWTVERVTEVGIRRVRHGSTKEGARLAALPLWLSDLLRDRYAARWHDEIIFPNPLDHSRYREVSHVGKLLRRLLEQVRDDDGRSMRWASSHTFRRTLVTTAHEAGLSDRQIASQTGHKSLRVLRERYIAKLRTSDVAVRVLPNDPRAPFGDAVGAEPTITL